MKAEFIAYFKTLTLGEQANLIDELRWLRHENLHNQYRIVEVFNYRGNISHDIRRITGFATSHEPGSISGTIGTNVVYVPHELYTAYLGEALQKYFGENAKDFSHDSWNTVIEAIINS